MTGCLKLHHRTTQLWACAALLSTLTEPVSHQDLKALCRGYRELGFGENN